ncbi:hypothetical protein [Staphylococcus pseudintermedius]|uniref:hypothetical protein n=2 Tax=Staphylococcus pseudintermedius TaxID=283734 RepID=UPI0019F3C921|nr:hypothetical protein [Staphylococcus pseudintermedius]EGQ3653409.1 hypothetical protein [Staphylococcus pseudintermedius]EGQ3868051.1 hypothetical protein [Staphylococcus pseudintermedius]EGQ3999076.1 hypothetical protein [Staphylococcus pseudintermedius]EGQ4052043.1 hypothetical protein [Staphylococcus pseudintermedius]EGQ4143492.1 hypothetical protein [Staphylococcus pseudintermedius]
MKIIFDDAPKTIIPFEIDDYSSLLLCSLLYQPLFIKNNNSYEENMVIDKTNKDLICFSVKEIFWSNGLNCTVEDIRKTLLYIIQRKNNLASYLSFIEGVEEYLEGLIDINHISIWCNKREIYIKSKIEGDYYKDIFSTIYFSPVYIVNNKINTKVTCGMFKLHKELELIPNKYNNKMNESISIVIDKNANNNIKLYESGEVDITCSTILYGGLVSKIEEHKDFIQKNSNLLLRLELKEGFKYKNIIHNILIEILYEEKKVSTNDINLKIKHENILCDLNIFINNISILCADFYPNNIIALSLQKHLEELGVDVSLSLCSFDDFLSKCQQGKYDIIINVVSPITQSRIDYFLEKITYFNQDYIDKYVELLNLWILNSRYEGEIIDYVKYFSNVIDIGTLKHKYLIRDKYKNIIFFDENDNLIVRRS